MNTPIMETDRLILRKFGLEDREAFFILMKDKEVNKFLPWFPFTTVEQAEKMLVEKYINRYKEIIGFWYAVCLKSDNIPIGYVTVNNNSGYDFGYGLRKEFWNKGIATEASKGVIERIKETDIPFITATHDINNSRSGAVLKKLGMTYCYSYKEQWQPKDISITFRMYQLNFDGQDSRIYQEYWDKYVHFIEENI